MLNVSPATVSNVLNGHYERVSEETKNRVWGAAEKYGYNRRRRNPVLRALESRTIIFIVVSEHPNEWFLGNLNGIADVCRRRNYILSQVLFPVWDPDYLRFVFANLEACGAIVITSPDHPLNDQLTAINIPNIFIDTYNDETKSNVVYLDNFQGAFTAVNYLVELGHRKIGFLSGGSGWSSAVYRERGYRAALEKHNIPVEPELTYNGMFTGFGGYMGAKLLIERVPDLTAIFAASDEMAMGALKAIKELNLEVPGDISVIGFDGHEIGVNAPTPLTTIETDPVLVGSTACEMLISMLETGSTEVPKAKINVKLIVRDTADPPRQDKIFLRKGGIG